jgi:hypothetical protein
MGAYNICYVNIFERDFKVCLLVWKKNPFPFSAVAYIFHRTLSLYSLNNTWVLRTSLYKTLLHTSYKNTSCKV